MVGTTTECLGHLGGLEMEIEEALGSCGVWKMTPWAIWGYTWKERNHWSKPMSFQEFKLYFLGML